MITGTDRVCTGTDKGTFLENHLPMDIRKVFGEREPESPSKKRKDTRGERNQREIQSWEVHTEERQERIQPKRSGALGSRHGGKRTRKEQSLFCDLGRTKNTVLHSSENPGQKSKHHGKRNCGNIVPFSERISKNDYL